MKKDELLQSFDMFVGWKLIFNNGKSIANWKWEFFKAGIIKFFRRTK